MEDKKANIISLSLVILLILVIIIARVSLKLSNPFYLIAGADIAAILAVIAFFFIRKRLNHRRKLVENQLVSEGRELRIEYSFLRKVAGVPTKFRYKELEEATDGFQSLQGSGSRGHDQIGGCLSWDLRYGVALDVAKALSYLHHDCRRTFQYFPKIVTQKLKEGRLMEVVDHRLIEKGDIIDERQVKRLICIALWCIQEKARLRPSMAEVVELLEGRKEIEDPPETQMLVVDLLSIDEEPLRGHHRARIAELASPQVSSKRFSSRRYSFSSFVSMVSGR
ncbi:Protein kinase domain-containing protein [Heracleum sosnowskyi]|uniref:Protein kinase domain-containing protein n=1 Tax=Heracleum sosnowskyi TaxID=360622 RepID=A0AAD8IWJ2_9APIA|nr:Protein kinase domain-containing protein [Heracleum sosnowskyi]